MTVEPRFNEPLSNEVLGITNDILCLRNKMVKYMEKKTDVSKTRCSDRIAGQFPGPSLYNDVAPLKTTGKSSRPLIFDAKLDAKKSLNSP